MMRISDLTHEINGRCSFDRVLTLMPVAKRGFADLTWVIHITQHYPHISGHGIAQVDFDTPTGNATIPHSTLDF